MRQRETENADVGLVEVNESDTYAKAYDLYDEIAATLSDKEQTTVSEILSLAENNYKNDSRQWDKILNRLIRSLNQLGSESEAMEEAFDDEDEQAKRSVQSELNSILEEAEAS